MGLEPGTTKADVRRCLENWNKGDNGILYLSRAFRLEPGSGWQIDPCILHAPGSLVTYEPQVNSDVFAMFQSEVDGRIVPWSLLVKDVPPAHHQDLDYIVDLLDWEANVNPTFAADNRVFPKPVKPVAETEADGYRELWISYGTGWYSAKELTVLPKRTVTIKDAAAYGIILTQGYGTFGGLAVSTPSMIRYGQSTEDELFVTAEAAKNGVRIENPSETDPLVILKHFGPGNPDAEPLKKRMNVETLRRASNFCCVRGCGVKDSTFSGAVMPTQISSHPQRDVAGARRQGRPARSRRSISTRCST